MDVYRLAHEYQIPNVLKSARSIVLQHIMSITLKGEYNSRYCLSHNVHCAGYCTAGDISEFLKKHFELHEFGETYQESQISLKAAERLSTLPMKQVADHPNYNALKDASKMQIMQY